MNATEHRPLSEIEADLGRASGRRRHPFGEMQYHTDIDRATIDRLLDERSAALRADKVRCAAEALDRAHNQGVRS